MTAFFTCYTYDVGETGALSAIFSLKLALVDTLSIVGD